MKKDRSGEVAGIASSGRWVGRLTRIGNQVQRHALFKRGMALYERHQRWAPLLFFFGGVLWDALTLDRIDAWFDNVILLAYLIGLGALILVAALVEFGKTTAPQLMAYRHWFPHGIQFLLGALFSAYVIFYFQSATLAPSSAFLVLLVILLVANEFIHQRLFNLSLLFGLYFLAACSFFIFFIPVVVKVMTYATFLAGALLSLGLVGGMMVFLGRRAVFQKKRSYLYAVGVVLILFGLVNVFYLKNWMPPVPLAMRYGGAFHYVHHQSATYDLRYEPSPWYAFWTDADQEFHWVAGETVYCFAAVFAPTHLRKKIYHAWSRYDEVRQAWIQTDHIGYELEGGRYRGYRGYTFKRNVQPGAWRVDVKTEDGHLIGRIRFDVVPVVTPVTELKQVLYE